MRLVTYSWLAVVIGVACAAIGLIVQSGLMALNTAIVPIGFPLRKPIPM